MQRISGCCAELGDKEPEAASQGEGRPAGRRARLHRLLGLQACQALVDRVVDVRRKPPALRQVRGSLAQLRARGPVTHCSSHLRGAFPAAPPPAAPRLARPRDFPPRAHTPRCSRVPARPALSLLPATGRAAAGRPPRPTRRATASAPWVACPGAPWGTPAAEASLAGRCPPWSPAARTAPGAPPPARAQGRVGLDRPAAAAMQALPRSALTLSVQPRPRGAPSGSTERGHTRLPLLRRPLAAGCWVRFARCSPDRLQPRKPCAGRHIRARARERARALAGRLAPAAGSQPAGAPGRARASRNVCTARVSGDTAHSASSGTLRSSAASLAACARARPHAPQRGHRRAAAHALARGAAPIPRPRPPAVPQSLLDASAKG